MQSLLRSYHDDDDSSSTGYSEPKGSLGRGLLGGDSSTSYYQSRGHSRMVWVGGLLVCLALVPLVMWPSKHDSLSLSVSASDQTSPPVQAASRFRPEVGDDDFTFAALEPEVQEPEEVVETLSSSADIDESEQVEPTTELVATLAPVEESPVATEELTTEQPSPTHTFASTEDPTPGIGAPHRKPFTYPPECSDADLHAFEANEPVSEGCRTAYKLFALEEGGKSFITRSDEVLPLSEYPAECTDDDAEVLDMVAGDIHSASVSADCARAYESAREAQLQLHLQTLEAEVAQLREDLSTDP